MAEETGATTLGRDGSWRDPPRSARVTGPACAFRRSSSYRAMIFLLVCCWTCLSLAAVAASLSPDEPPSPTLSGTETSSRGLEPEILLIDTRIPVFIDGHWRIMSDEEHRELRRREAAPKEEAPKETSSTATATTTTTTTTEVVVDVSKITDSSASDPVSSTSAAASPLPSPFDGALAANFSTGQSCPNFINAFLSNATFKACYPVSLLLQGSQSFFEAERSFFAITRVLDAACDADVAMCTDYFNGLAKSLIDDSNCGKEYDRQNALVVQAYKGMKTYEVVYRATCLTNADADSSGYCFANAITNASTASNVYLYYLPFNSTLPSYAVPACGSCTQQTMQIYQAATSNRKAEISNTYQSAAEQINSNCGDNFVNTALAAATNSATTTSLYPTSSSLLLFSFLIMTICHWIL
ncbi:hypothetical protein F5Y14DRAFT_448458 [Nemania sp. NC0429]|nr:hypothetical protein F5Y14DRAFT_448458 [Nemania sp. NC0429]